MRRCFIIHETPSHNNKVYFAIQRCSRRKFKWRSTSNQLLVSYCIQTFDSSKPKLTQISSFFYFFIGYNRLDYTLIYINSKLTRKARYVYIHPEHQCNHNELLPAIVEMNESIEFDKWTQPAVLPPTALQIHERILAVAISHRNIEFVTTNKMNVMIYSDEICEMMNPGENGNRLLCIDIESICSDCNICEVKLCIYSII